MKKFLLTLISIIFFACMFVGFYMMISYAGRNTKMTLIFTGVTLLGLAGIFFEAFIIYKRKKKASEEAEEEDINND